MTDHPVQPDLRATEGADHDPPRYATADEAFIRANPDWQGEDIVIERRKTPDRRAALRADQPLPDPHPVQPDHEPTRVTFGEWEPDPESAYEDTRLVAQAWSIFKVWEYREVTETRYRRERRKRVEFWITPARTVPVFVTDELVEARHEPAQTIGRWEWEYRSAR
jgi:hypothetical protein